MSLSTGVGGKELLYASGKIPSYLHWERGKGLSHKMKRVPDQLHVLGYSQQLTTELRSQWNAPGILASSWRY